MTAVRFIFLLLQMSMVVPFSPQSSSSVLRFLQLREFPHESTDYDRNRNTIQGKLMANRRAYSTSAAPQQMHRRYTTMDIDRHNDYKSRPGPWDDPELSSLLDANKAWRNRMQASNPDFFSELQLHAPMILWIGCSDARVPANEIIGEPPGSVFVHRNIANQVVSVDFNCMSVIQFAVDVLKVKHIVVCGHYDCGGIKAALEDMDHKSPLENWLRNIRDTYRLHMDELNAIPDRMARQRRLVELNVIEQCVNIFKTATVQRRRVETHNMMQNPGCDLKFSQPRIHAMVYEPTTGEATKLDIDFANRIRQFQSVYELYHMDKPKPHTIFLD